MDIFIKVINLYVDILMFRLLNLSIMGESVDTDQRCLFPSVVSNPSAGNQASDNLTGNLTGISAALPTMQDRRT